MTLGISPPGFFNRLDHPTMLQSAKHSGTRLQESEDQEAGFPA
jgi:hypothetical protein